MESRLSSESAQCTGNVGKEVSPDCNDKGVRVSAPKVTWTGTWAQDSSTPLPFSDNTFIIPAPLAQDNGSATGPREEVKGESRERCHPISRSEQSSSRTSSRTISSPSSVDLEDSKELPTNRTDTSDATEEGEERTSCIDLQGKLYINRVFNMNADKMFEMLFTDSQFLHKFVNARKITDLDIGPWDKDPSGNLTRTLKYIITITNPLIGKFSTATEKQTMSKDSQSGLYYLIDAEVITHDVPYHDYFYTHNRYCIIQTSKRKCRLRVSTDVHYTKQPWSLVKSFIQKNSWSGLEDYFKNLESDLLTEEILHNPISADPGLSGLRRRRRGFSRGLAGQFTNLPSHLDPDTREGYTDKEQSLETKSAKQNWKLSKLMLSMSVILIILAALNFGLFVKLLDVENVAQKVYLSNYLRSSEKLSVSLDQKMIKQETKHKSSAQLEQLRAVIKDSILLLEQLKSSLAAIQKSFELRSQTVKSAGEI
ncbi:protein Aster-C isoform X1 [Narcine bancroftii]|uniref:protein Aster-C isoform X1 n=1 Tax=Narcine bancroftii TaxID=1343680 RepID=UPI003830FEC9